MTTTQLPPIQPSPGDSGAIPPPTRAAALARLDAFARTGVREYGRRRNYDLGAASIVSRLSPHVRHRLVLESELVAAALREAPGPASAKFVQEVFWRSYWKGWLELRPAVWHDSRRAVLQRLDEAQREPLGSAYADACAGRTGIDCFDAWVHELVATGYLHNHVRMWFASIWSYTLRLPWELGADFFQRHLLDGDAASNTLSWRWVVGLQTPGKVYLARADNIAKYTDGRFSPRGLATHAEVPAAREMPAPAPLPPALTVASVSARSSAAAAAAAMAAPPASVLLIHEDDLLPETLGMTLDTFAGVCVLDTAAARSPQGVSARVKAFTAGAQQDASARLGATPQRVIDAGELIERCSRERVTSVFTPYAPVGPARERLDELEPSLRSAGMTLHRVRRDWDEATWPLARRGFFAFAEHIPELSALVR